MFSIDGGTEIVFGAVRPLCRLPRHVLATRERESGNARAAAQVFSFSLTLPRSLAQDAQGIDWVPAKKQPTRPALFSVLLKSRKVTGPPGVPFAKQGFYTGSRHYKTRVLRFMFFSWRGGRGLDT